MADGIRIGAIITVVPGNESPEEQLLGARLAADYTRNSWGTDGPTLELVERPISDDVKQAESAAADLLAEGCSALMGMSSVPVSAHVAGWCEQQGMLFLAANN